MLNILVTFQMWSKYHNTAPAGMHQLTLRTIWASVDLPHSYLDVLYTQEQDKSGLIRHITCIDCSRVFSTAFYKLKPFFFPLQLVLLKSPFQGYSAV